MNRDPLPMTRIAELQAQIEAAQARSASLLVELNRSLAIGQLWPRVWDRAKADGLRVSSVWFDHGDSLGFRVMLRDRAGAMVDSRTFARPNVPPCLDNPRATESRRDWLRRSNKTATLRSFDARQI